MLRTEAAPTLTTRGLTDLVGEPSTRNDEYRIRWVPTTSSAPAIGVSNGEVTLDLIPVVAVVKQDLASRGLPLIDEVPIPHVTLPLFPSRDLERAQTAVLLFAVLGLIELIGRPPPSPVPGP